ncbi:MAG: hypothetical protein V4526_02245 [Patescibacteria group bacterium]
MSLKTFSSYLIITLFTLSLIGVPIAHAQIPSLDPVVIEMDPIHPSPGGTVNVKITSFSTDLNRATISWFNDGKTVASGVGITSVKIIAPAAGKSSVVIAAVTTTEGSEIKKVITITPTEVNIMWESDGYTPPFYKGKANYAHQSYIKFIALPNFFDGNGNLIPASNLIYKWRRDYQVLGNQSGYGKQYVILPGNSTGDVVHVGVEVSTKDNKMVGEAYIIIDSTDPSVVLYKESPLYGVMYNNAIGENFSLTEKDTRIKAVPYSFSFTDKQAGNLQYTWLVNNIERQDLASSDAIDLTRNEEQEGYSSLLLRVRDLANILQTGEKGFTAYYSKLREASNIPEF